MGAPVVRVIDPHRSLRQTDRFVGVIVVDHVVDDALAGVGGPVPGQLGGCCVLLHNTETIRLARHCGTVRQARSGKQQIRGGQGRTVHVRAGQGRSE